MAWGWPTNADLMNSLAWLHRKIDRIQREMEIEMATLDETLADVADESTKIDGLITLTNGLRDQVKALPGISAENQAKIDQIFAGVEQNKAKVQAAIDQGTT